MAIDTRTPQSPGWWMARLADKLRMRQTRLELLDSYFRGEPPLVRDLPDGVGKDVAAFLKRGRVNLAELAVEAIRERCNPVGFHTGAANDKNGDRQAWGIWNHNGLDVESASVHQDFFALGDSYTIVGLDEDNEPLITAEDPREVVTIHDPVRQRTVLAGLKIYHDDTEDRDFVYLYLRDRTTEDGRAPHARRYVASRYRKVRTGRKDVPLNLGSLDWVEDRGGEDGQPLIPVGSDEPINVVPVVRFRNRRGVGEFEPHLDLLDRIFETVVQRLKVQRLQAFRQLAFKGLPTVYPAGHPKAGEEIDYSQVFSADPGAWWHLPAEGDIWESQVTDMRPMLEAAKDDIRDFAAVTRTPLYLVTPVDNQTAEGAQLAREGLVYKSEDRIKRLTAGWADTMSIAFLLTGDVERANRSAMRVLWAPVERFSLSEKYDAAVKAKTAGEPWRSVMTDVLQKSPEQITEMQSDRAGDRLLDDALGPQGEQLALPGAPETQ